MKPGFKNNYQNKHKKITKLFYINIFIWLLYILYTKKNIYIYIYVYRLYTIQNGKNKRK